MGGQSSPRSAAPPVARTRLAVTVVAAVALVVSACESPVPFYPPGHGASHAPRIALGGPAPYSPARPSGGASLPPGPAKPNVYAASGPGMFVPATRAVPPLVYVPNAATGAADMIDQRTGRRIGRVPVGGAPALIVPDHDLRRLWVSDPVSGLVRSIGPRSARRGKPLRISRPGTLYFTPDGRAALILTGRANRVDFRHPRTMDLLGTLRLPCKSVLHADFSADGSSLLAACPTSRKLVRVDPGHRAVTGAVKLPRGSRPGDLRLSPDGRTFFVADPAKGGLWTVDAASLRPNGFVRTGPGAHGLMFDRAYRRLFVTGGKGTVSAVDVATRRVSQLWRSPGGRPLDPGGVSTDGDALWLSDPSAGRVYALSTRTGRPLHDVRVGGRPGSPCVYPQPGRYSLGGPGLYR